MIARAALVAVVLASAPAGASAGRPAVALTASPTRLTVVGRARQTIRVANIGSTAVVLDATPAGFSLGPRGRPRVLGGASARTVAAWLHVRPRRLALLPGAASEVAVFATPSRAATPGDHAALVLLSTRASRGAAVPVRMRLGVTVVVRVPGRIVHRLVLRSVHALAGARGVLFRVVLANRGNVVERLGRGRLELSLLAGRRRVARRRSPPRELLPGATALFELPYDGKRGRQLTARVTLAGGDGRTVVHRTLRLRV